MLAVVGLSPSLLLSNYISAFKLSSWKKTCFPNGLWSCPKNRPLSVGTFQKAQWINTYLDLINLDPGHEGGLVPAWKPFQSDNLFIIVISFICVLLFATSVNFRSHFSSREVVPQTLVCWSASCQNVGATGTPRRSYFAVSSIQVTKESKGIQQNDYTWQNVM